MCGVGGLLVFGCLKAGGGVGSKVVGMLMSVVVLTKFVNMAPLLRLRCTVLVGAVLLRLIDLTSLLCSIMVLCLTIPFGVAMTCVPMRVRRCGAMLWTLKVGVAFRRVVVGVLVSRMTVVVVSVALSDGRWMGTKDF